MAVDDRLGEPTASGASAAGDRARHGERRRVSARHALPSSLPAVAPPPAAPAPRRRPRAAWRACARGLSTTNVHADVRAWSTSPTRATRRRPAVRGATRGKLSATACEPARSPRPAATRAGPRACSSRRLARPRASSRHRRAPGPEPRRARAAPRSARVEDPFASPVSTRSDSSGWKARDGTFSFTGTDFHPPEIGGAQHYRARLRLFGLRVALDRVGRRRARHAREHERGQGDERKPHHLGPAVS